MTEDELNRLLEDEELRRFIEERLGKLEDLADLEEALDDPEMAAFIEEFLSHRDPEGEDRGEG